MKHDMKIDITVNTNYKISQNYAKTNEQNSYYLHDELKSMKTIRLV